MKELSVAASGDRSTDTQVKIGDKKVSARFQIQYSNIRPDIIVDLVWTDHRSFPHLIGRINGGKELFNLILIE